MKLGIVLIVLGGFTLGANLWASFALLAFEGTPVYIFTGLALPAILLFFGIKRLRTKRQGNEKTS